MAFWDSILDRFKQKQVGCVELHMKEDNTPSFNFVLVSLEKDKLNFEKSKIGIDSFDDLKKEVNPQLPIVIVLTGKGVIQRKVDKSGSTNKVDSLKKVFPNAIPADFYTTIIDLGSDHEFIGVARKEHTDKILQDFASNNYFVVDLLIGAGGIFSLQNAIQSLPQQVNIINGILDLDRNEINQAATSEDTIEIGGDKISSYALTCLAGGFSFLVEQNSKYIGDIEIVQESAQEFNYKQKFKMAGLSMLILFFLTLLVNYFIFDHYNTNYNRLSADLTEYQGFLSNYTSLKNELEEKKLLLIESGMIEPSKVSYFGDRIAAGVPKGIVLLELEINPAIRKKSGDRRLLFSTGKILITGKSDKSTVFYEWVKVLGQYEWVQEVSKFTYNQQDKNKYEPAEFNIEIEY